MPLTPQQIAVILAEKKKHGQMPQNMSPGAPQKSSMGLGVSNPYKSQASPELPSTVSMPKQHLPAIKPLKLKKFSKLSSIIKPLAAIKPPKI